MTSSTKRPIAGDDDYVAAASKKRKLTASDFQPTRDQMMVCEEALQRNTIFEAATDSDRADMAAMVIGEVGRDLGGKVVVFLAPTIHLVNQRFEEIKTRTNLSVMEYYGKKGVDQWNAEAWERERNAYQVMVMTPQVLLDALKKAFLTLDTIRLVIFDECHYAVGNHPYSKIMQEFYCKSPQRPSIFGMTISHLLRKGISSLKDCEVELSKLESILDSKFYTVAKRSGIDCAAPAAKKVNRYYDPMLHRYEDLKARLRLFFVKFDASLADIEDKEAEDILNKLRKDSLSWNKDICDCLNLGLICANEAVKICSESVHLPYTATGSDFYTGSFVLCKSFLKEVMHALEGFLLQGSEMLLHTHHGHLEGIKLGYISPKLFELLQIFNSIKHNQVSCLIFVERIIIAQVIARLIKKIKYLSDLNVSCLTEGSSSSDALTRQETMDLFRTGKVNLLFATNVSEEELLIPECSCVICFDLPKTINYKGPCGGPNYIIMIERGNIQQRDLLFNAFKSKHSVVDTALKRGSMPLAKELFNREEIEAYRVDSTGATVTINTSINLIYSYCDKLRKDKNCNPRPTFQFNTSNGSCECKLTLPPSAALQDLVGPLSRNNHKAKQLACLSACKTLHQLGALNDHLQPLNGSPLNIENSNENEISAAGAGTTKRKELHGTVPVTALSGTWAYQNAGVTLQGYKLSFTCNKVGQMYDNFVLLIDAVLDQDVAYVHMDLFLVEKMVKAVISPCGPIHLEAEQVEQAKRFHELFFNGVFGKLFRGSKSSGVPRQFLLMEDDSSLWNSSNMYMLLPLESDCTNDHDTIRINWKGIRETACTVEFFRCRNMSKADSCSNGIGEAAVVSGSSVGTNCSKLDVLHLANKTAERQTLKDRIVMAIHTGKIYSIVEVVSGSSSHSPFESSDFATFSDYFIQRYNIVLKYPEQPLLLLKHSHNPHNLLSSHFNFEGDKASKKSRNVSAYVKKAPNNVYMPPELLVHIDVPLGVLKSLYLLPTLMNRMESLMLASQLRSEIGFHPSDSCIASSLILEAITTSRCCEDFSSERLEHLGDSVLKYAVSSSLYLKYPEKNEGQLTSSRQLSICNATLHKLGVNRNVQCYIRDAAFDPRRWVAPGQLTVRPFPCKCDVAKSSLPFQILQTDDNSIVLGKACDSGHRWMCSKTISDCVEALIGAYYVGGGLTASIAVLKWLGLDVEVEAELVEKSILSAPSWSSISVDNEIRLLESKLGYEFRVKGLLLEAITHSSQQDVGTSYCYERLEFLGDSVLDVLITWYLFNTHKDIDPGELTDLRSASVNNERFAQCAVKHRLEKHLQYSSDLLLEQITEYATRLEVAIENDRMPSSNGSAKGPGVLGDMVESIAGAILIDTRFNLNKVWEIFEPLLSPIVTPDKLELPPVRELLEFLSHEGYFLNSKCTTEGDMATVELSVQLESVYLAKKGCDKNKKAAKGQAAFLLLKELEKQGILRDPSKPEQLDGKSTNTFSNAIDVDMNIQSRDCETDKSQKMCDSNINEPVCLSLNMEKGGPRIALHQLCQKSQWPMPRFEPQEEKISAKAAMDNGAGGKKSPKFVSNITLHIPNSSCIKLQGEPRDDKKSSQDAAALVMLYELQKQGRCHLKRGG